MITWAFGVIFFEGRLTVRIIITVYFFKCDMHSVFLIGFLWDDNTMSYIRSFQFLSVRSKVFGLSLMRHIEPIP